MYECVIGITSNIDGELMKLSYKYMKAVARHNAYALIIPYNADFLDSLDMIDGLLLTGGGDFSEEILNEGLHPLANNISPLRDRGEKALFNEAFDRGMPVLGICRGAQLINLAQGGSIIQHIDGHIQKRPRDIVGHNVEIDKDSLLFGITKRRFIGVNSFHHQAIDRVCEGFRAVAYSEDGRIEAIEGVGQNFALGVQWHPECLLDSSSIDIFNAFVSCSIDFKHNK